MFTGIIECIGEVIALEKEGSNVHFSIQSSISSALKIDQSLAHDGVCLTVTKISGDTHQVTAVEETINKTNLGNWSIGKKINLERAATFQSRIDGHLVQGHVDGVGICKSVYYKEGSWEYTFQFEEQFAGLMVEKGSISLNGTSLTVFGVSKTDFKVAIIPYTYENTTIQYIKEGAKVNLEFDIIGKYVARNVFLGKH